MRKLLLLILLPFQIVNAQQELSLDTCYSLARENYPNLKNSEIWRDIASLKKQNIQTGQLPRVSLQGQATYQSDVPGINISMPGFSIPDVPKDQYKAYAEVRQNIWDGGMSDVNEQLEDAILQSNLSQLDVELYKLNEQILQVFFTVLAIEKQAEVINAQRRILTGKLESVKSGIKNQVLGKSAGLAIEAEILSLEQNEIQLRAGKAAALGVLSILTGKNIQKNVRLNYTGVFTNDNVNLKRPEIQLFNDQYNQLGVQMDLLEKSRNPKIFGFGQAGFGRPGLNLLNDNFDSFYLIGVGLSWNAFDWKNTSREKQILHLRQEMILNQEETFRKNISTLLEQQEEEISKLNKQLENDQKIVDLKKQITGYAESKLKNGTITSSEYIRETQAETIAKINLELHKIQLNEAKEKYKIIQGTK